jgi:hypothetical protein
VKRNYLLVFFFAVYTAVLCYAQTDTLAALPKEKEPGKGILPLLFAGKPGKALGLSLLLPGAGQVYNRSAWKVPIVYAGLGTMAYFIHFNSTEFKRYDRALRERVDHPADPQDEFVGILSDAGINSYRKYYDKNLQLSYVGLAFVYLLNGVDAFVDAHLKEFDISGDLSLQIQETGSTGSPTLSLSFRF